MMAKSAKDFELSKEGNKAYFNKNILPNMKLQYDFKSVDGKVMTAEEWLKNNSPLETPTFLVHERINRRLKRVTHETRVE